MKTTLIKTRRFNKETYYIYLKQQSYNGESGCLGIELEPYIIVKTPSNCFGYTDSILFDSKGNGRCLNRSLPSWIMKELEKENKKILQKYARI